MAELVLRSCFLGSGGGSDGNSFSISCNNENH